MRPSRHAWAWPLLLSVIAVAAWAATEMMSVQVREGQLRAKPSFLGKVYSSVYYGDRLSVLETQGSWVRVQGDEGGGWIHSSALTPKKVVLQSGSEDMDTGATSDELALAGKGFNDEVEAEYRELHPKADFTWVDRMEKMTVSSRKAVAFLREGGVGTGGTP